MADPNLFGIGCPMIKFDAAEKTVHCPADRRFRIWFKPSFLAAALTLVLLPFIIAWGQAAIYGLPYLAASFKLVCRLS